MKDIVDLRPQFKEGYEYLRKTFIGLEDQEVNPGNIEKLNSAYEALGQDMNIFNTERIEPAVMSTKNVAFMSRFVTRQLDNARKQLKIISSGRNELKDMLERIKKTPEFIWAGTTPIQETHQEVPESCKRVGAQERRTGMFGGGTGLPEVISLFKTAPPTIGTRLQGLGRLFDQ